jgi:hypothetical protein
MLRRDLLVVLLASSGAAQAQTTWYVDVAGTAPGTGTQLDPYTSIQHAISQPSTIAGDTVLVAAGTYFENVDFLGKAIAVRTDAGAVIDANNVGSVVSFVTGEGPGSVLDGFTLTHGRGTLGPDYPAIFGLGGGVYCVGASPTLENLVVQENIAQLGAGLYFAGSRAIVHACVVRRNGGSNSIVWPEGTGIWSNGPITVTDTEIRQHDGVYAQQANRGGGVYGSGKYTDCTIAGNLGSLGGGAYATANLAFLRCTFEGNAAFTEGNFGPGGGIYSQSGPSAVTATDSRFRLNVGADGGGAYAATLVRCSLQANWARSNSTFFGTGGGASQSTLLDCDVSGNGAGFDGSIFDWPGSGGGLSGGSATRCTITDNWTISGGGSGFHGGGGAHFASLVDCDVHGNYVLDVTPTAPTARGGGVLGGSATRCRIWDNSAPFGGGACDASLSSCTVSGNTASVSGGGIAAYNQPASLLNSICWDNSGGEVASIGGTTTATWSDVRGGHPGTGNIDQDPLFANPLAGDFALGAGSPCINAGDPAAFDADGSRLDMGAVPFTCSVRSRCVGKVNSQGCTPEIDWSGTTSLSGTDDFVVTGSGFVNQKAGMLFWGRQPQSVPFQGGTLCVQGPLTRTPIQDSGGNPLPPPDCSGTYAFSLTHAYMLAHSMLAHQTIHAQWYSRDPAHPDGTGISLSNAIEITICP